MQILTTAKEVKGTANDPISATIPAAGIAKSALKGTDFGLNDDAAITKKLQELFPDGIPATKTGCTYTVTGNFNADGAVGSIVVTATGLTAQE